MSRAGRWALAAAAVALAITESPAQARSARRVLLVVLPAHGLPLGRFAGSPQLPALGLITTSVGNYNEEQTLLDITQGARVPRVDYSPEAPPALSVTEHGVVRGWRAVLRRAAGADASIEPGLLASMLPGGAAYVSAGRAPSIDAVLGASRAGVVAAVSLGTAASLARRVARLRGKHLLVVVDLAGHGSGLEELHSLLASRPEQELVLLLERPPATTTDAERPPLLLALGAAGLSPNPAALTTQTTRTDGLVTASDLGPTILRWLHLRGPSAFSGQAISTGTPRSASGLDALGRRLSVIEGRRTTLLLAFLAAWTALLVGAGVVRRDLRLGLRLGALGALWAPSTALLGAALEPGAIVEALVVVGGALSLAIAIDRIVPWPRAAAVPVAVMLALVTIDLARGSQLIETSVLGSNPISGSRFFGVGNELAALLPVALFTGLAAALPQHALRRREIVLFAGAGALLTAIVAWGRLGANVGSIFTIGAGTAIATMLLAQGRASRRGLALAAAATLAALALLALLDLLTGGGAHFTREVLQAHSLSALAHTLGRRLSEAYDEFLTGAVWIAVLVCLAAAAVVIRQRRRVLAPVDGANAWGAGLGGGLAGLLLGSVANDSGPRLLLVGSFMLVCTLAYIHGGPDASARDRTGAAAARFLSDT